MEYRMTVKVNPGTSQLKAIWRGDHLKVNLLAPPEDGKANEQLISFIADTFGLSESDLEIVKGETSQHKTIILKNLDREVLVRKMNSLKG
jgi:hypothetical protein